MLAGGRGVSETEAKKDKGEHGSARERHWKKVGVEVDFKKIHRVTFAWASPHRAAPPATCTSGCVASAQPAQPLLLLSPVGHLSRGRLATFYFAMRGLGEWPRGIGDLRLVTEALREEKAKEEEEEDVIESPKSALLSKRPLFSAPTAHTPDSAATFYFQPPLPCSARGAGELLSLAFGAVRVVGRVLLLS